MDPRTQAPRRPAAARISMDARDVEREDAAPGAPSSEMTAAPSGRPPSSPEDDTTGAHRRRAATTAASLSDGGASRRAALSASRWTAPSSPSSPTRGKGGGSGGVIDLTGSDGDCDGDDNGLGIDSAGGSVGGDDDDDDDSVVFVMTSPSKGAAPSPPEAGARGSAPEREARGIATMAETEDEDAALARALAEEEDRDDDPDMAAALAASRATARMMPARRGSSSSVVGGADEESFSAASSAPAPAAGLSYDDEGRRRSSRKRKSTVIMVGEHAVKVENNYVVRGMEYVAAVDAGRAAADDEARKKAKREEAAAAAIRRGAALAEAAAGPVRVARPRVASEAEVKRTRHNEAVRRRAAAKAERRTGFLARHVEALAPFLDGKVEGTLRALRRGGPGTVASAGAAEGSGSTSEGASCPSRWVSDDSSSSDSEEEELMMQPDAIAGDMRDYQLAGLNWLARMHRSNLGCILGDEMGLGKTLQTIALLAHIKTSESVTGPSLVICPLSVLYSWCDELTRWAPSLRYLRLHSSSSEEREAQRAAFVRSATEYDVVVTTYEMAKNPGLRGLWRRVRFNYLVLDEGHKIKQHDSQISQAARRIHRENALILTGTPLQNNLVELWSLLNFLYPDVFTDSEPFGEAFDIGNNGRVDRDKLLRAHELLDLLMLRRLKGEVERLLPKKIETKVICPLSSTQVFWYKSLLMKDMSILARADDGQLAMTQGVRSKLSNLIMQLRKCCLHPFLFDGAEVDVDATTVEELVAASGKLAVLDRLLRSLYVGEHRVVLFSQFTSALDILEDYCQMRGWRFCRFDGGTPRARRNFTVKQFNLPGSETFIFLMSTRAGGMGLNLQTADTCILYDSDWNPQPDIQAMARVHRIGQTKTVHVYRLVCGGTIEERIIERAEKKLYLDQMVNRGSVVGGGGDEKEASGQSASELLSTLKFGCNAVFGDSSQNLLPTDSEIEVITDRARTEDFSDGKLKGGTTRTAEDFDADRELSSTTKFRGVDFKAIREEQARKKQRDVPKSLRCIATQWATVHDEEKRQRKNRLVMVQGKGSGYGSAYVPVLAANNYELEKGESSVFSRELGGRDGNFGDVKQNRQYSGRDFGSQDFCQICGDGGDLICCPLCPVCIHEVCVPLSCMATNFRMCPHHRCCTCHKNNSAAGGLLFPCQSCCNSFCEDCLPSKGVRLLFRCDRFEELGFASTRKFAYIHCSQACEERAQKEFGWSPELKGMGRTCPEEIDVSYNFGK